VTREPRRAGRARCQALVVSGFLGAGKTTLVRRLLAHAQRSGVRAAVVSNEFGELGIDRALLARPGEAYVELEGGCVCCRLSDELVATLELLHRRVDPEWVIVETSGVAMPFDTQLNFWREPVSHWIEDDLAVVVVNAEQVARGRDLDAAFEQQVSSADLLLLNKIDLVEDPRALAAVERRLRELEPEAPLLGCVECDVEPALLFPPDAGGARARRRRDAAPTPHAHEAYATEEVAVEPGLAPAAIVERLGALGSLRAKGFVQTSEGLRLVQGVGSRLDLTPVETPPPPGLVGRVVVIRRAG
jgi:cobalamin biosynthesis protein CobW